MALGFISYSNTFGVPFQWDDHILIKDNPFVKGLDFFRDPSVARGHPYYTTMVSRYVGYLSFALNYYFGGLYVWGYHLVNIAVHLANALLVYMLVVLTFRTPAFSGSRIRGRAGEIALISALIFVAHPVQTEAVTYIFQRLASFAAFFYMLSLGGYILSRLSGTARGRYGFYALSFAGAVLAMKTKENAFTLPVAIALYEYFFFRGPYARRIVRLAPLALTMLIVPLSIVGIQGSVGEVLGGLGSIPRGSEQVTRTEYLISQTRVVATYLRLVFFPAGQNVDYDYPVYRSVREAGVVLAIVLHAALVSIGVWFFVRSRRGKPELLLTAFGILWFYLALSVESGIIPIPMLINEYRVYLPGAFFIPGFVAGVYVMAERFPGGERRVAPVILGLFLIAALVLSAATFSRNRVWRSETSLWEDTVRKSPGKARGYGNLGFAYKKAGRDDEALASYLTAVRLNPHYAKAHNNIGVILAARGQHVEADGHYRKAIKSEPGFSDAHFNLGLLYIDAGRLKDARREFRAVLRLEPYDREALKYLRAVGDMKRWP